MELVCSSWCPVNRFTYVSVEKMLFVSRGNISLPYCEWPPVTGTQINTSFEDLHSGSKVHVQLLPKGFYASGKKNVTNFERHF